MSFIPCMLNKNDLNELVPQQNTVEVNQEEEAVETLLKHQNYKE